MSEAILSTETIDVVLLEFNGMLPSNEPIYDGLKIKRIYLFNVAKKNAMQNKLKVMLLDVFRRYWYDINTTLGWVLAETD